LKQDNFFGHIVAYTIIYGLFIHLKKENTMPYINIRLGASLSVSQHNQLYTKTTSLMNKVMDKRPEVTVVHIQESEPHFWSTNSSALGPNDPIGAYVDIKVTEGTNTPEEKAEMISETVKMLKECIGMVQEACYVVIDDIPANSWGYDGKTQADRSASTM
jgi:4-oxalocrotonate tautomerase